MTNFENFPARSSVTELPPALENNPLEDVAVLMPIGGKATRAQEVTKGEIPKHLIKVDDGQTVLDLVCKNLQRVGFRRFVFCVGHQKNQIEDYIEAKAWIEAPDVTYDFSPEDEPLGPDGAIRQAIGGLALHGRGMIVPGDAMLPWKGLARMCVKHQEQGTDVTVGVTSKITERTTDVGRMLADDSNRMIWCFDRTEPLPPTLPGCRSLTSAAATAIAIDRYTELCEAYLLANPDRQDSTLSFRDQVLPWAIHNNEFSIQAFDVAGEVLDLGTPSNIHYGQENWRRYV